ncbi:MAG TPA: PD-(D/E)XK nuclease family protein, partial [bacterium]|nr:PD-(D/E)XK nuclease family protein [bacterium]
MPATHRRRLNRRQDRCRSDMRVSASQLNDYLRCPRCYQYRYLDRLDRRFRVVSPAQAMGESIHAALHAFFLDPDPARRTREQLANELRRQWRREAYRDRDEERQYGLRALDLLDRYYFRHDMTVHPLRLEYPFAVQLGAVTLAGVIDRIDAASDGTHCLIDYKTGRHALTLDAAQEDLQLTVYALAFRARYGKACERLQLHYLALNFDLTVTRSDAQLDAAQRALLQLAATMQADREYAPRRNSLCPSCPYTIICPLTDDVQENETRRLDAGNRRLYLLFTAGVALAETEREPDAVLQRALVTVQELLAVA